MLMNLIGHGVQAVLSCDLTCHDHGHVHQVVLYPSHE